MAIPRYDELMLPLLLTLPDKKERHLREIELKTALIIQLSEEDKTKLLPSGKKSIFYDRLGWARTYLLKAGLVESKNRGYVNITNKGIEVLKQKPETIDVAFLLQYNEFKNFYCKNKYSSKVNSKKIGHENVTYKENQTPEEVLENTYQTLLDQLSEDLLDEIKKNTPQFFERLVVDLLLTMGYGGSKKEAGEAVGKSGDGGIDGVIKEDRLGLSTIYLQAKRWEASIGAPELRDFVGALQGKGAIKGVFITTSNFTKDALEYIKYINQVKVILIDGEKLAKLMTEYNVGINTISKYEIKKIDYDYFTD